VSVDVICNPVEVRRCRFIESVLAAAADTPPRPVLGGPEPLPIPDNKEPECERGRVVDEAILGRVDDPFRELPPGAPEARFLQAVRWKDRGTGGSCVPLLDHVCFKR
jgi:hypothetical protein